MNLRFRQNKRIAFVSAMFLFALCCTILFLANNTEYGRSWQPTLDSIVERCKLPPLFIRQVCSLPDNVDFGPHISVGSCAGRVLASDCHLVCLDGFKGTPVVDCPKPGGTFVLVSGCSPPDCTNYTCPSNMVLKDNYIWVNCGNAASCKTSECCALPSTLSASQLEDRFQQMVGVSPSTMFDRIADTQIPGIVSKITAQGTTDFKSSSFDYVAVDGTAFFANTIVLQRSNSDKVARVMSIGTATAAVIKSLPIDSAIAAANVTLPQTLSGVIGAPRWRSDFIVVTRFKDNRVMSFDPIPILIDFPCTSFLSLGLCRFAAGSSTCEQNVQVFTSSTNPGFCSAQSYYTSSFLVFQRPYSEYTLCGEFVSTPDFAWTIGGVGLSQTLNVNTSCTNNFAGAPNTHQASLSLYSNSHIAFIDLNPKSTMFRVNGPFTFDPMSVVTARLRNGVVWNRINHIPLMLSHKTSNATCTLPAGPDTKIIDNCPTNFQCLWEMNEDTFNGDPVCSLALNVVESPSMNPLFTTLQDCKTYKESDFFESVHNNMSVPYYAFEIYQAICGFGYVFQIFRCRSSSEEAADALCRSICQQVVSPGTMVNLWLNGMAYYVDPEYVNPVPPSPSSSPGLFGLFALLALPFLLIGIALFFQHRSAAARKSGSDGKTITSPKGRPARAMLEAGEEEVFKGTVDISASQYPSVLLMDPATTPYQPPPHPAQGLPPLGSPTNVRSPTRPPNRQVDPRELEAGMIRSFGRQTVILNGGEGITPAHTPATGTSPVVDGPTSQNGKNDGLPTLA